MRILIVRQDKLGDNLLTTPVPSAIRAKFPDAEICVMAQETFRDIWKRHPEVGAFWPVKRRPGLRGTLLMAKQLKKWKFDAVLLVKNNSSEFTIASFLARIPIRIGNTRKWYRRLMTHNLRPKHHRIFHEVLRGLEIAEVAVKDKLDPHRIVFDPTPEEVKKAEALASGDYFIMHPTTGGTQESVAVEVMAEAARQIAERTGWTCVVTGAPGEELHPSFDFPNVQSLIGQVSLGEFAALAQKAKLYVSVNTGVTHICAGQGTPVINVETRENYELVPRWEPWMTEFETVLPHVDGVYQLPTADRIAAAALRLAERLYPSLPAN